MTETQEGFVSPFELFNRELGKLMPRGRLAKLEKAISYVAPKYALRREQTRRSIALLRAQGAYTNRGRQNAIHGQAGETPQRQRERRQLMWNALELIDNSGLGESITGKYADYVFGRLRYQARTGDKYINEQLEAIMKERCGCSLDLSGRHSLRTMMRLSVRGVVVKGGIGLRLVRPEPESRLIYVQGYEYDRIGGLYAQPLQLGYADGVGYDPNSGRETFFDTYQRNRFGGFYQFEERCPAYDEEGRRVFLHLMNPKDFDQYKGETAFKTVIDHVYYVDEIRKYELQALHMAATQSIIYYTKDGNLPRNPYEQRTDSAGHMTNVYRVGGNEVSSMEVGEEAKMFEHNRTSPNVIAAWDNTETEICNALQLPRVFALGKGAANGPDVRFQGKQAARSIQNYWANSEEKALDPIAEAIIGNEIAHDMSLYHPNWRRGRWIGPADISIDAGYESAALLNEVAEGVETRARICAMKGEDSDEMRETLGQEAREDIILAVEMAKDLKEKTGHDFAPEFCLSLIRRGANASTGIQAAVTPRDPNEGATSDGVEMPGDKPETPPKPQREVIDLTGRGQVVRLSAFVGDVRLSDLAPEVQAEVRRFVPGAGDQVRIPKYGMVPGELLNKADPHNLDVARERAKKKTRLFARDDVNARRDAKFVLLLRDRVVDGHHFLADAERGKVTNSLHVLDLTPALYQSTQTQPNAE